LRISKGLFNTKLEDDIIIDNEIQGPLFGFEYNITDGKNGELIKQVLLDEGIDLTFFKVKNFPQMSVQGSNRNISLQINDLQLLEIKDDEFFPEKRSLKISFSLTKNSYATVVLTELMKSIE
jgi:tRNA(Glu) U13 pseudouridine synthase TruD